MSVMSRIRPFVVLDVLVTLPLLIWAAHDTFRRYHSAMFGFELTALICVAAVMLPSVVCLSGLSLRQIPAVALILFYLLMLVILWFRILNGWHDLHHATLIRVGVFLLIAKSIYGVVSVTKHDA
jgi:hypothetical protein